MNDKISIYDLVTRKHVDFAPSEVTKEITRRTLKDGSEQDRYRLRASYEGRTLFKFVSRATYDALP